MISKFFKGKNEERRNADFYQAVSQLADLVLKAGMDSDRQIDMLTLYGLVNPDGVSKDSAVHLLGVYSRARSDLLQIYLDALSEFDAKITETVNCSLEDENIRIDAFLTAYQSMVERITHEVKSLAQSVKSSYRQREVTAEFYKNT